MRSCGSEEDRSVYVERLGVSLTVDLASEKQSERGVFDVVRREEGFIGIHARLVMVIQVGGDVWGGGTGWLGRSQIGCECRRTDKRKSQGS